MKSIEEIKKDLKSKLSEKRYEHSLATMEKAIELAKIYGEDEKKAAYAALVHDIAKEMTDEEFYQYIKENNLILEEIDKIETIALHGRVGADIARKQYGFTEEMCDAICYHTTGRANMTLLDKIVYIADKIEEKTRKSEYANEVRNILKNKGLDEAIINCLDTEIFWKMAYHLEERNVNVERLIHPNSIYARNDIIMKLKAEN